MIDARTLHTPPQSTWRSSRTAWRCLATLLLVCWTLPAQARGDAASDPASYFVPASWSDKARRFVEPGPEGLDPGLPLESLTTGANVTVTFAGKAGRIVLSVVPAALGVEGAAWTGRRVAVVVGETTLSDKHKDIAVAHFVRVLEVRESGWGWLRRDPKAKAKQAAAKEARQTLRTALRLAWLGHHERALTGVVEAAKAAPKDTVTLTEAARVVYIAERPSRARLFGEAAVELARKATAVESLPERDRDRVRVMLASALALAQQTDEAVRVAQDVVSRHDGACDLVRVVRDLETAGAYKDAVALAASITDADYRCDAAWALRVDLARWGKDAVGARKLGTAAIERRNESMLVRSAAARAALATKDAAGALANARVAAQHSGGAQGALVTLLNVVHNGGADATTLERWDGALARQATPATMALGVASCWHRDAWSCVTHQLEALRGDRSTDSGLAALHAMGLARFSKADTAAQALSEAWALSPLGTEVLAAEAEVAEATGRMSEAVTAWTAYIARAPKHPGPLPIAVARARLAGISAAAAHAPGRSPQPAVHDAAAEETPAGPSGPEPSGPPWTWIAVALFGVAALVVVAGARGAPKQSAD